MNFNLNTLEREVLGLPLTEKQRSLFLYYRPASTWLVVYGALPESLKESRKTKWNMADLPEPDIMRLGILERRFDDSWETLQKFPQGIPDWLRKKKSFVHERPDQRE